MEAEHKNKSRCTVEADLALLRRYQSADQEALGVLLEVHYGLIKAWVHELSENLPWVDRDDILQLASLGFIEAAKTFEVLRSPYFHWWAKKRVSWAIYNSPDVRLVKRTLYGNYSDVIEAQEKLMQRFDRKPTIEELSEETKLSVKQVENALNVIAVFALQLEAEDGKPIEEPYQIEDPYESQLIIKALKQLSSDEVKIIILSYYYGYKDREIAEKLGRSEDAIKMARTRALKKSGKIFGRDGRDGT